MTGVVNIHKEIIPWIRSIADPMAVNANSETLKKWENGTKPSLTQVDKMSKDLNVPFGYFFLSTPYHDANTTLAFRTIGNRENREISPNLKETVNKMRVIQEWLKDELTDEKIFISPFSGLLTENDNVESACKKIRALLGIEKDWYRKINKESVYSFFRKKAGDNQVYIFESGIVGGNTRKKLDINEFRAFALFDSTAPLIFINSSDDKQAKAFSLLHELVHIAKGQNDLMEGNHKYEETFCNSVAAEILVPADYFVDLWTGMEGNFTEKLKKVSSYFKCSFSVVTLKAFHQKLITKEECYNQLQIISSTAKSTNKQGGNYYTTASSRLDHNFLSILFTSVHEGKTRYTEAYRMTECNGSTFNRLMLEVLG